MGTNFRWFFDHPIDVTLPTGEIYEITIDYMDPMIHVGKRSGIGNNTCNFTWAQDPVKVRLMCEKYPDTNIIQDEYGEPYTGASFLKMLEEWCKEETTHSIGEWFG